MTREERTAEIVEMLRILKRSSIKSHKDTAVIGVKLDSFIYVIDSAIKALEQKSILDKIRAEIEARLCDVVSDYTDGYRTAIQGNLAILDKYKAETEAEDGNDNNKI